ncbi:DUF2085 domain-containing protein [uncultured Ruminococcus sp.]|uniref:DUF2085 domain-containing protein n=1 Tax=uncultured Ruminococcus sp. TaxID=165186 RepID=UPI00292D2167|nr:DUF2085 domain-containing protein [uncultured Ruminococcus sp.]
MKSRSGKRQTIYNILWRIGKLSGCHQLKDRSFHYKNKQFPVCARCTGVFVGYLSGLLLFFCLSLPIWVDFLLCEVMLFDWLLQRLYICDSTNPRRFITGVICGIAVMQLYITGLKFILDKLIIIVC